jgi:glutamate-1-semialdehyde 2,1-aminomutase
MKHDQSKALWQAANNVLVGGVNSPVRAFNAVGGDPFFAASGSGPCVCDADGNEYIDYVLSWGPLILGHAHPDVVRAIQDAAASGSSFGIPTENEIKLAEKIITHYPSMDKVRLVNSGTEATMSAIRLARGYTGRDLVVKIEGCYHGHVDGLLVKAGSGLLTLGTPTSPGIPEPYAQCTLTIPFNNLDAAREVFEARGEDIACIILEPVAGNMGMIPPAPEYLQGLRELTNDSGALLIFDEVMTGSRVAIGGAQMRYGIRPDLTTLGKVIGGGLPVGAYGGKAEIMQQLSPEGPVYQAGTLSGNPLATAAGLATLTILEEDGVFDAIEKHMTKLTTGLQDIAQETGVPIQVAQAGTMAGFFFNDKPVSNFDEATTSDGDRYAKFFQHMLDAGVYFAPSQFETFFLSTTHDDAVIDQTLNVARDAFKSL